MKLTRQERAALRAAFQKMSLADKAEYIYSYYKLPILLGLIALFLLCSTVYQQLTKKRPSYTWPALMSLLGMIWALN